MKEYHRRNKMITLSKTAYQKSQALTNAFTEEVGWFGFCTTDDQFNITIHDVHCSANQRVTGASCTVLHEGDNELIDWEDACRDLYGNGAVRAWFHSHVNMATNPSGQDAKQLDLLSAHQPFYIRIIMNKQGDMNVSIACYGYVSDIKEINIDTENPYNEWAEDLAKKVIKPAIKYEYPATTTNRSIYSNEKEWDRYNKSLRLNDNQISLDEYYQKYWGGR